MYKFKTGDRIDIAIELDRPLSSGYQLMATVCRGSTKVSVLKQNNGITTTDQKIFRVVLLPTATAALAPGAYSLELAIMTADHQFVRVSSNKVEFMMYDSITGKEAVK